MAKREDIYRQQLQELGIYEPAFEPEIRTLADLERDWTRAKKAWSASALQGEKPSMLDPHYAIICNLRREILVHRETLGLTPKALRKLRGAAPSGPSEQELITKRLDLIAQRVSAYDVPERLEPKAAEQYAAQVTQEWDGLVSKLNTEADTHA